MTRLKTMMRLRPIKSATGPAMNEKIRPEMALTVISVATVESGSFSFSLT